MKKGQYGLGKVTQCKISQSRGVSSLEAYAEGGLVRTESPLQLPSFETLGRHCCKGELTNTVTPYACFTIKSSDEHSS